jgi:hypothetical protein
MAKSVARQIRRWGRIAGYRIGGDQSAGMKAILQIADRLPRPLMSGLAPEADVSRCNTPGFSLVAAPAAPRLRGTCIVADSPMLVMALARRVGERIGYAVASKELCGTSETARAAFWLPRIADECYLGYEEPSEYFRFPVSDSPMTRAKVFGKAAHHANDDEALYFDGCIRRARIRSL